MKAHQAGLRHSSRPVLAFCSGFVKFPVLCPPSLLWKVQFATVVCFPEGCINTYRNMSDRHTKPKLTRPRSHLLDLMGDSLPGTSAHWHIQLFTACFGERPDILKLIMPCGQIGETQHNPLPRVACRRALGIFDAIHKEKSYASLTTDAQLEHMRMPCMSGMSLAPSRSHYRGAAMGTYYVLLELVRQTN